MGLRGAVQDGVRGSLPLYQGVRDAARTILRDEGWRSLYAGLSPALIGAGGGDPAAHLLRPTCLCFNASLYSRLSVSSKCSCDCVRHQTVM